MKKGIINSLKIVLHFQRMRNRIQIYLERSSVAVFNLEGTLTIGYCAHSFFFFWPRDIWDSSTPNRDGTLVPCAGSEVLTTVLPRESPDFEESVCLS